MSGLLKDRTVVITGAASGIGRAAALGFIADGANVVGADIDVDGLASLQDHGATTVHADCASDADMRRMVQTAVDVTGRIDVLFSNAGYGLQRRVADFRDGEYEHLISVHVFGALYAMRAAVPHMRAQEYGRIITTLSRGAEGSTPGHSAYASAKAALWALMRTAASELVDDGILVNGLIPGMTNTRIWGKPRPELQQPEAVYPAVRALATLEAGGPHGRVFFNGSEYPMFERTLRAPTGPR
jgi:NAD(P)-dependent dehydrogenase (short-subunit alcohol dehydrogenase family)